MKCVFGHNITTLLNLHQQKIGPTKICNYIRRSCCRHDTALYSSNILQNETL